MLSLTVTAGRPAETIPARTGQCHLPIRINSSSASGSLVAEIAAQVGTPFYLYSKAKLLENFNAFLTSFAATDATICFAVKSCSNIAILKLLNAAGAGADTVSGGEIRRALRAGIAPEKIIFSGLGKTREEIAFALESGIGQLNVESTEELEIIDRIAAARSIQARVSVRVNPDVDAGTHDKISTGRKADKFGIPWTEAWGACQRGRTLSHLKVEGVACHIGSQITDSKPFNDAFAKVTNLARELQADGFALKRIDLGGGLGITYKDENPIGISDYAALVMQSRASAGPPAFPRAGPLRLGLGRGANLRSSVYQAHRRKKFCCSRRRHE